jgi:hypothetical protein
MSVPPRATATPVIFSKITIEGNGATLQLGYHLALVLRYGRQLNIGPVPGNSRLFAVGIVNDAFPRAQGI